MNNLNGKEEWSDFSPVDYVNYGQHDNPHGDENCFEFDSRNGGVWNAGSCFVTKGWICEIKVGKPTLPTTTGAPTTPCKGYVLNLSLLK